jgi:HAD superfamily hydrolase (TIGR01490 family)
LIKDVSAAFFDIDHTLTRHSTAIRCIVYNLRKRRVPIKFCFSIIRPYFRYKKGTMSLNNCDTMMEGMDGLSRTQLDSMGKISFRRYHEKDLYGEMVDLIGEYRKAGIPVVLATSSPRFVAAPYFEYLKADHLIATELGFNEKDETNGTFVGMVAFDSGKRERVDAYMKEKGYDAQNCAFYSDSIHDLPCLSMVGSPVAVNPDRELAKHARKNSWDILDYRRK